jgi:large subunit ribosomal protein L5
VGLFVTLRKDKMYSFIERFVHLTLPRIRDFRGIDSKSFDGKGNYNIGIQEQLIFPEIKYEDVDQIRGLDISFVTTAKTDEEGLHLLKGIGMPFKK